MSKTIWLFNDAISINLGYYPMWDMSQMSFAGAHKNDWIWGYPCLDMTLRVWRFNFNVIFWKLPDHKNQNPYNDY